jgi:hypothetical protein
LQGAQRAIPVVGGDEHAFAYQRRHGHTQQPSAPTAQRAPPHVPDGEQLLEGDSGVKDPERPVRPARASSVDWQ